VGTGRYLCLSITYVLLVYDMGMVVTWINTRWNGIMALNHKLNKKITEIIPEPHLSDVHSTINSDCCVYVYVNMKQRMPTELFHNLQLRLKLLYKHG
jgi:hypothetical protein